MRMLSAFLAFSSVLLTISVVPSASACEAGNSGVMVVGGDASSCGSCSNSGVFVVGGKLRCDSCSNSGVFVALEGGCHDSDGAEVCILGDNCLHQTQ